MPATMRYGAAEIFGRAIQQMTTSALRQAASADHKTIGCPYKSKGTPCHKKGGVCSLVQFEKEVGGAVNISAKPVTTCPTRFYEGGIVHSWVAETLIGTKSPVVVNEVSFLMADSGSEESSTENEVGPIDSVLVNTASQRLEWCALEMQAVYFSGKSMDNDFRMMHEWNEPELPLPPDQSRPNYLFFGSKHLSPQSLITTV
jgi:hypothetical protein